MPFLFVSHRSAIEALRAQGTNHPRWPESPRFLPVFGECVCSQRDFVAFSREVDLAELGIESRPVNVLVPTTQYRHKGKGILTHPWRNLLPKESFLRITNNVLVSSPEFALLQLSNVHVRRDPALDRSLARYREERDALQSIGIDELPPVENLYPWEQELSLVKVAQIAMELCGTYRLPANPEEETSYGRPRLTTVDAIKTFLAAIPGSNGYKHTGAPRNLAKVLNWVMERSRSPRETALALMLTLPLELGGYGLPQPALNQSLEEASVLDVQPDLLWKDARLVVEYDSSEFHADAGADKVDSDIVRANRLRAAGYTVLEVTPGIVSNPQWLEALASQVAGLLGVAVPPADYSIKVRRSLLHKELFFS